MKKDIRSAKVYYPCQDDLEMELTAYINSTDKEIYISIEDKSNDEHGGWIVLNADTAEELAKDLLKQVKWIRNNNQ